MVYTLHGAACGDVAATGPGFENNNERSFSDTLLQKDTVRSTCQIVYVFVSFRRHLHTHKSIFASVCLHCAMPKTTPGIL